MREDERQADQSPPNRAETGAASAGIDPELGPPDQRPPPGAGGRTLAVIAVGGAAGALARYGLSAAFPHPAGAFDWATLGINVSGCALIGALMVAITEVWPAHPLVRPFLAVGVLGGFTTFSTYIVDIQRSLDAGAAASALAYLAVTLAAALAAAWAGITGMRALGRRARPPGPSRSGESPPSVPGPPSRPGPAAGQ
jgi:CrcB protein